jgi:hypothetical protein
MPIDEARHCSLLWNVHDHHVVEVTSGSFERETQEANPHPGAWNNKPDCAAKNAADLETGSCFGSAFRTNSENILHTKNNCMRYDFKKMRIVTTHYVIRTNWNGPGGPHLKSWSVEASVDGETWWEVAREENNGELFLGTFAVTGGGECRFIRLVNIGRNHLGRDSICISVWEIFGTLID